MISKLYTSFILECIKNLEQNPLYSEKLKRLKALTKVSSTYLNAMTEVLLELFWFNDTYHTIGACYNFQEEEEIGSRIDIWLNHYEKMCKTYIFDVHMEGYEQMISRTIQVPYDATLGTLGLAIIESIGGQSKEFYMSHGDMGLYPGYFNQQLHFTESDPYETELAGFEFGNEPMEMLYCGLTIKIQLKEIQTVANIYEPQSYIVLGGMGLNLCIIENTEKFSSKMIQSECSLSVPLNIRRKVEEGVRLYEASYLVSQDSELLDEMVEVDE